MISLGRQDTMQTHNVWLLNALTVVIGIALFDQYARADDGVRVMRLAKGVARGADDGHAKYRIEFKEVWAGSTMVSLDARHMSLRGQTLMRRRATWTPQRPLLPNLTVDYPREGRREVVKVEGGQIQLGRRKSARENMVWKTVKPKGPTVNGATIHVLLEQKYSALESGQTVRFSLLAPSRLDWYRFRAKKTGFKKWQGRRAMTVEVEPDSFLIRLFAKKLIFYMDCEYRVMSGYAGMVMVKDDDDENYNVVIDFSVPPGIDPQKAPFPARRP